MKKLFIILAVVLLVPSLSFALSLTVSASTSSGTSLAPHKLLQCKGYLFTSDTLDPWDPALCTDKGVATTLSFGALTTRLKKPDGTDGGAAGCFYGGDFFIVYLFPDAWGGKGYELKQAAATFPTAIQNSVIMKPVYADQDKFSPTDPGGQGILNDPALGISGEQLGTGVLAYKGGLILKAKRGRIVRAQYSIPPYPKAGDPNPIDDPLWKPVPLTTPATTYTSGAITISITEF